MCLVAMSRLSRPNSRDFCRPKPPLGDLAEAAEGLVMLQGERPRPGYLNRTCGGGPCGLLVDHFLPEDAAAEVRREAKKQGLLHVVEGTKMCPE